MTSPEWSMERQLPHGSISSGPLGRACETVDLLFAPAVVDAESPERGRRYEDLEAVMKPLRQRIDRLHQQIHSGDLAALAERLAAEHGLDAAELLTEARMIARREAEIGKDAALQELADRAGIPVDQLLAEAEELGRAA